jgi:hypothetical protein
LGLIPEFAEKNGVIMISVAICFALSGLRKSRTVPQGVALGWYVWPLRGKDGWLAYVGSRLGRSRRLGENAVCDGRSGRDAQLARRQIRKKCRRLNGMKLEISQSPIRIGDYDGRKIFLFVQV